MPLPYECAPHLEKTSTCAAKEKKPRRVVLRRVGSSNRILIACDRTGRDGTGGRKRKERGSREGTEQSRTVQYTGGRVVGEMPAAKRPVAIAKDCVARPERMQQHSILNTQYSVLCESSGCRSDAGAA